LQNSLVEHSSQGTFTLEGRHDILATSIGQLKHPGHVLLRIVSHKGNKSIPKKNTLYYMGE